MMNKVKSKRFNDILNNKTSGSSELVDLLNKHFLKEKFSRSELNKQITLAIEKLGHFQAVSKYLNELKLKLKNEDDFKKYVIKYSTTHFVNIEKIFNKIYPELKKINSLITLSRSGTLLSILKLLYQKNKKIKVVVCESRPKLEGKLMAEDLAKCGMKVLLITDAMMNLYVPQVDAAIIGADIILKNGTVVNKVGSKSLALLCREYNKPFFVVSTRNKFSKRSSFHQKNENSHEILDKNNKNLSASNIYFEEVEKKFITKIFIN